jgi:phenylalanyl-tRNA synthetase beta chain
VTLRVARAAKVIGMPVTQAQCAEVFQRLGLSHSPQGEGTITVTPPSWRFDLKIEEDLIEEVIRVIGYDKLPDDAAAGAGDGRACGPRAQRSTHAVRRHRWPALDYQETINFSFVEARWEHELAGNADPIRVLNPIAAPLAVMRSSLIGSLVAVLRTTWRARRPGARVRDWAACSARRRSRRRALPWPGAPADARGRPGLRPADVLQWGSKERASTSSTSRATEALLAPRGAFRAREHPALHPGRCARIELDGRAIGHVGRTAPAWRQAYELPQAPVLFELDLDAVLDTPGARAAARAAPAGRLCATWRWWRRRRHPRRADAIAAARPGLVRAARCSTSTSRRKPGAGMAGANAAWPCAWNCWTTTR